MTLGEKSKNIERIFSKNLENQPNIIKIFYAHENSSFLHIFLLQHLSLSDFLELASLIWIYIYSLKVHAGDKNLNYRKCKEVDGKVPLIQLWMEVWILLKC